jgi:hypothetical protein
MIAPHRLDADIHDTPTELLYESDFGATPETTKKPKITV